MSKTRLRGSITIDRSAEIGEISPRLYGGLVELIGETVSGGLNAEIIRNRKFVDVSDPLGNGTPANWEPVSPSSDRLPIQYVTSYISPALGTRSLCLFGIGIPPEERVIRQAGLALRGGQEYTLSFHFRSVSDMPVRLTVSIADERGEEVYETESVGDPSGRSWRAYTYRFTFPRDTTQGELRIRTNGAGCHYVAAVSLLPADSINGLRREVVEGLENMGLKLLRFPGGCAAEGYDWRMAIGARDARPTWLNAAWCNFDDMDTGTDELCWLAKRLGGEAHLTVNISTLSEEVAAQWVEYCNGGASTPMGQRRAANGHPEPYGVKVWGLGNEANNTGFPCEHTPEEYVALCNRFMAAMRAVDPTIEFVLVGNEPQASPGHPGWDATIFRDIRHPYEYHAVHLYTFMPTPRELEGLGATPDELATVCAATPQFVAAQLRRIYGMLESQFPKQFPLPRLYLEEWGLISLKTDWETDPATLSESFNLRGALLVAGVFNTLLRLCDKVGASNVVYPTGVEYVFRNGEEVHVSPAALVVGLHQKYAGKRSLEAKVESPTFSHRALGTTPAQQDVPYLDVAVSIDDDRRMLSIMAVNRHIESPIEVTIDLRGFALLGTVRAFQVAHIVGYGDLSDWYSRPAQDGVGSRDRMTVPHVWCAPKLRKVPYAAVEDVAVGPVSDTFVYTFPAHSFTVIVVDLQGAGIASRARPK